MNLQKKRIILKFCKKYYLMINQLHSIFFIAVRLEQETSEVTTKIRTR